MCCNLIKISRVPMFSIQIYIFIKIIRNNLYLFKTQQTGTIELYEKLNRNYYETRITTHQINLTTQHVNWYFKFQIKINRSHFNCVITKNQHKKIIKKKQNGKSDSSEKSKWKIETFRPTKIDFLVSTTHPFPYLVGRQGRPKAALWTKSGWAGKCGRLESVSARNSGHFY